MKNDNIKAVSDNYFVRETFGRTIKGIVPDGLALDEKEIDVIVEKVADVANTNTDETRNVIPIQINLKRENEILQLCIIVDIQDDETTVIFY